MLPSPPVGLSPPSQSRVFAIARAAIRDQLLRGDARPEPPPPAASQTSAFPGELNEPAGCFVSLHERRAHRLRGCVGRIDSNLPLHEAVRQSAIDVLHDPRFTEQPVTLSELGELNLEISILSPPRDAASPLDFDLLNDGLYLVSAGRTGFFLPQVARETGWTKEQLLERLCTEKLHLPPDTWRKTEARLYTFQVEVIGPEPL